MQVMRMFNIEKNIPLPPKMEKRGNPLYPFADMQAGDSFLIPVVPVPDEKRITANVRTVACRYGMSVTFRRENAGLRVWVTDKKNDHIPAGGI